MKALCGTKIPFKILDYRIIIHKEFQTLNCVVKQELKEGKEKKWGQCNQEKNMLGTSVNCTSIDREPNNVGLIFYASKCFLLR